MSIPTARLEVFETTWPDRSFTQFGGHVLERLFQIHERMVLSTTDSSLPPKPQPRFKVTVRVEVEALPDA